MTSTPTLREALEAVDAHWVSLFPYGPDEPDAHKAINPAALAAWCIVRSALSASPSSDGWHDIATAPRDGTHILVCFDKPPYGEHWTFQQSPPTVAHWFGPPDLPGLRAGGWYLSVHHSDSERIQPTHWRLLPDPPAEQPQPTTSDGWITVSDSHPLPDDLRVGDLLEVRREVRNAIKETINQIAHPNTGGSPLYSLKRLGWIMRTNVRAYRRSAPGER